MRTSELYFQSGTLPGIFLVLILLFLGRHRTAEGWVTITTHMLMVRASKDPPKDDFYVDRGLVKGWNRLTSSPQQGEELQWE
jgi:hypothetical protein